MVNVIPGCRGFAAPNRPCDTEGAAATKINAPSSILTPAVNPSSRDPDDGKAASIPIIAVAIVSQSFQILIGDANGADKALQGFLKENHYSKVTVYCSGGHCRNNVGSWETYSVQVPAGARCRDFCAQKDRMMAKNADYGFLLWDSKSPGLIENVISLLKDGKSALVYYSPDKNLSR